jgi:heterodisulfide reductase subunit C
MISVLSKVVTLVKAFRQVAVHRGLMKPYLSLEVTV